MVEAAVARPDELRGELVVASMVTDAYGASEEFPGDAVNTLHNCSG